MAELTYRDAVAAGIAQEMARDERVVFLGEDVAAAGGVFKATVGLLERFGPKRVRDCPISEQAILGAAMGAGVWRPQALAKTASRLASRRRRARGRDGSGRAVIRKRLETLEGCGGSGTCACSKQRAPAPSAAQKPAEFCGREA